MKTAMEKPDIYCSCGFWMVVRNQSGKWLHYLNLKFLTGGMEGKDKVI